MLLGNFAVFLGIHKNNQKDEQKTRREHQSEIRKKACRLEQKTSREHQSEIRKKACRLELRGQHSLYNRPAVKVINPIASLVGSEWQWLGGYCVHELIIGFT